MPGTLPPDPETVSNGQLYLLIDQLRQQVAQQAERTTQERSLLTKRVEDLTGEVAMARKETAEMVDLWKSGKTIVWIFKAAGAIATSALALWGVLALVKGVPVTRG